MVTQRLKGINKTSEMNPILEQITLSVRCCITSSTLSSDCINLSCKSKMRVSVNETLKMHGNHHLQYTYNYYFDFYKILN